MSLESADRRLFDRNRTDVQGATRVWAGMNSNQEIYQNQYIFGSDPKSEPRGSSATGHDWTQARRAFRGRTIPFKNCIIFLVGLTPPILAEMYVPVDFG